MVGNVMQRNSFVIALPQPDKRTYVCIYAIMYMYMNMYMCIYVVIYVHVYVYACVCVYI